jgi:release factor glutamine methyltransferase
LPKISEAIDAGTKLLREGGISEERRTAALLLAHVLQLDRAQLLTGSNQQIKPDQYEAYLELVGRRARGEPLQYITGHREFYGLDFTVTPAVLIPRPETEFLVERVITLARQSTASGATLIVDLGTGSGCIAVALAVNLPGAHIIATDISSAALDVARANALRHGVHTRVEFIEGDLFVPLAGRGLEGSVDFLAFNPPYVPEGSPETIQREVRDWEPPVALYGGSLGLDFYERVMDEGGTYLKPGGCLVCEIGYSQLEGVCRMIKPDVWELVEVTDDLQGIPRTLTIRRVE